ncbi:MAG: GNAT family protein [Pseudomonadota bacterium]
MSGVNALGQPLGARVDDWQPPARPPRTPMEGRTCRVEPLDPARHGAALFTAYESASDDANWTYLPYGPFEAEAHYLDWLEAECTGDDPHFHAVIDLESEQPVGVASYLRIAPDAGSIEVGHIHFSPKLQCTVASTEAMFLMMQRAFALGYRRYEWKCNALNAPSRRAAQRLGFSYEGVFRQAGVYKGRNRDTAWYAMIDAEWPRLHAAFEAWLDPANFVDGVQQVSLTSLTAPILVARG